MGTLLDKRRLGEETVMRPHQLLSTLLAAGLLLMPACSRGPGDGADAKVTTLGSIEVTAQLEEIPGEFIDRLDYDYAFVMKYKVLKVHRGKVESDVIYVGHYNPQKARDAVADARVTDVGGSLKRFRVGDVHRMALEIPIDDYFMGGIINRYFEQGVGPIYWALWTNPAAQP